MHNLQRGTIHYQGACKGPFFVSLESDSNTSHHMTKIYRKGAIGALLDEYERAIADLKKVIEPVTDSELSTIADAHTMDEDCKSIQTVMAHVVYAGYGYATSIHNLKGHNQTRLPKTQRASSATYIEDLTGVFAFTEKVLQEFNDDELEQHNNALKIKSGWGQIYDVEQMMEHAIVHILRHRRQIEKFILVIH